MKSKTIKKYLSSKFERTRSETGLKNNNLRLPDKRSKRFLILK